MWGLRRKSQTVRSTHMWVGASTTVKKKKGEFPIGSPVVAKGYLLVYWVTEAVRLVIVPFEGTVRLSNKVRPLVRCGSPLVPLPPITV